MTNKTELDELIEFIQNFSLEKSNWTGVPKPFARTHPNEIPSNLLSKFLSMKTMFELTFDRNLKTESEQKPHGGYRKLEAFKQAEIVYDFTMEFIRTYRSNKSYKTYITYKTCEQIEGAARSGKQNTCPPLLRSGAGRRVARRKPTGLCFSINRIAVGGCCPGKF